MIIERNNQGKHQVGKVILKSTSTQLLDNNNSSFENPCSTHTTTNNNNNNNTPNISTKHSSLLATKSHFNCNSHSNEASNTGCELAEMTGVKANQSINMFSQYQSQQQQHQASAAKHNQLPIANKYAPLVPNANNSVQNSILAFSNNNNSSAKGGHNSPFKFNNTTPTTTTTTTTTSAATSTSSSLQKAESVLKSKMKKLMNKMPTRQEAATIGGDGNGQPVVTNSVRARHAEKLVEPSANPAYDGLASYASGASGASGHGSGSSSFYNNVSEFETSLSDKTFS